MVRAKVDALRQKMFIGIGVFTSAKITPTMMRYVGQACKGRMHGRVKKNCGVEFCSEAVQLLGVSAQLSMIRRTCSAGWY